MSYKGDELTDLIEELDNDHIEESVDSMVGIDDNGETVQLDEGEIDSMK